MYNATEERWFEFIANRKNTTNKNLMITGYRCVGSCFAAVPKVEVEDRIRLWDVEADWEYENGTNPGVPKVDG